jgi:hypothetical protein
VRIYGINKYDDDDDDPSHHLLNVLLQIANKLGIEKKKIQVSMRDHSNRIWTYGKEQTF